MSPAAPSPVEIAVLRYVQATGGRMADPGNLQVARGCVAKGWLTDGEGDGFGLTPAGEAVAGG